VAKAREWHAKEMIIGKPRVPEIWDITDDQAKEWLMMVDALEKIQNGPHIALTAENAAPGKLPKIVAEFSQDKARECLEKVGGE
jgi:hypothetical protein